MAAGQDMIRVVVTTVESAAIINQAIQSVASADTGWLTFSVSMPALNVGETIELIQLIQDITLIEGAGDLFYADTVVLGISQKRMLGMTSDFTSLYVTSIEGGLITLITHSLTSLLPTGTATFGAAAYTDPDTLTRGLWPVRKPGADQVLYLRGRDGADKHVQYNNLNGTLGWENVGATAVWGTAKFCVALMPSLYQPAGVVAAFSDDDVYHTLSGTSAWTKLADAPTGLRAGGRHPTGMDEMLLAGTAAGTLHYTHNLAESFDTTGGTAIGTINWIEFSRF